MALVTELASVYSEKLGRTISPTTEVPSVCVCTLHTDMLTHIDTHRQTRIHTGTHTAYTHRHIHTVCTHTGTGTHTDALTHGVYASVLPQWCEHYMCRCAHVCV